MAFVNETIFSIESNINEETGEPFGEKYRGTFAIRRPNLQDKIAIASKQAAALSAYGASNPNMIAPSVQMLAKIFAFICTVSKEEPPAWFDATKLHDEDELALAEVWSEVQTFLRTFRPKNGSTAGAAGDEQSENMVP